MQGRPMPNFYHSFRRFRVKVGAERAVQHLFCRQCGCFLADIHGDEYPYCSSVCIERHWMYLTMAVLMRAP
jgi:hypothetical protein